VLRHSSGLLHAGNILVSNYNDKANLQGTGSTIVQITPSGHMRVFAHITKAMLPGSCPGGIGLSTALVVLPGDWVVVGSAPSANGQVATAKAGCLIVLDSQGNVRETLTGKAINGPWDATATTTANGQLADVFITNVFNGTAAGKDKIVRKGTVARITLRLSANAMPRLAGTATIATGLAEQGSTAAFVLGPTGLGLGLNGTLYIADTVTSAITAIPDAMFRGASGGPGATLTTGGSLLQPLGLAIAPNGDVLTVNGGNGKIVETTPAGQQVASTLLDNSGSPAGAGALFGLDIAPSGFVYYVDDVANSLRILR
jgi:sugar lactone lactonase YvrE